MRTRNSLERLAAAGRPPLADAAPLVEAAEEDRILARILATPRDVRRRPRLRPTLVLVAVAAVAALVAVVATRGTTKPNAAGHHPVALSGATLTLAGYHFRTPAGFKKARSDANCQSGMPSGDTADTPISVAQSLADAAEANGGCLEALLISGGSPVPADAQPVAVGSYNGFLVARGSQETLYVDIPAADAGGGSGDRYLTLVSDGLTSAQLIAIAESGLPASA